MNTDNEMKEAIAFMVYEGVMAFTFLGAGVNFALGSPVIALFYLIVAFLSYGQVIMYVKKLNITPFYLRWLR